MPARKEPTPAFPTGAVTETGEAPAPPVTVPADPEAGRSVRRRRTFTAQEKLRILNEADAAAVSGVPGAVGAVLRREGIYSSMLCEWRRLREDGMLQGLTPQPRGPKPQPANPLDDEVSRLRRENSELKQRLERARQVIDVQKKLSEILSVPLGTSDTSGSDL